MSTSNGSGTMTQTQVAATHDNVTVVRRVYDAFERGDVPTIFALFDSGGEIYQSTRLPWGGRYEGHGGLADFLGNLTGTIESRVETERFIDDGDGHVVASGVTRGTVVATGRRFEVPETHVWTVEDGRIVRFESYVDAGRMREALGL